MSFVGYAKVNGQNMDKKLAGIIIVINMKK